MRTALQEGDHQEERGWYPSCWSFQVAKPRTGSHHLLPTSMPRKTALALVVTLLLLNCGAALHATELALNGALNTAIPARPASAESRPFGLDRSEANASPMIEGFSTANPASATAPVATPSGGWLNPGAVPTSRLDARPWSAPTLAVAGELPTAASNNPGVSNSTIYAGLGVLLLALAWACSGQLRRGDPLPDASRYERVSHRRTVRVRMLPLDMQG